ncbi:MAG: TauD/TfdA dioxygenase family protein [Thermonemataceae bacterium]|mgnify:CR=1 FL=1
MHLSIFSINTIPTDGASTYFSNLHYAYERLPASKKEQLRTLTSDFGKRYKPHPIIWEHPITATPVLHISEGFKNGFIKADSGDRISKDEAEAIHQFLNDHMWETDTYYEHSWQQGDLIIADNYAVAHFAKPNYSNTLRVLHRTATKGERRKRDLNK